MQELPENRLLPPGCRVTSKKEVLLRRFAELRKGGEGVASAEEIVIG